MLASDACSEGILAKFVICSHGHCVSTLLCIKILCRSGFFDLTMIHVNYPVMQGLARLWPFSCQSLLPCIKKGMTSSNNNKNNNSSSKRRQEAQKELLKMLSTIQKLAVNSSNLQRSLPCCKAHSTQCRDVKRPQCSHTGPIKGAGSPDCTLPAAVAEGTQAALYSSDCSCCSRDRLLKGNLTLFVVHSCFLQPSCSSYITPHRGCPVFRLCCAFHNLADELHKAKYVTEAACT